ncbi:MAG: Hsp33 family molecular chaperone HslO [Bacilli bacterium]
MEIKNYKDYLVRATAGNDQIRAFALTNKDILKREQDIHQYSKIGISALGQLLSAGLLMGDMQKNSTDELTLQIKCEGQIGYMVVTGKNDGSVRGTMHNGNIPSIGDIPDSEAIFKAIGKGTLTVIEDLGMKEPYTSQIDLQNGDIAENLTYYFTQSEQTQTNVGLDMAFSEDGKEILSSGGYVIQLMPNASKGVIAQLEKNIAEFQGVSKALKKENTPESILRELLNGFDISFNGSIDVSFHCDCNHQKGANILKSLGKAELDDMISEGKEIEIVCSFCGKKYSYPISELEEIRSKLVK